MFNFKTILLNNMKNRALFFANLKGFTLVATFFSLWLAVYFENRIEDFFAYFLILSLGILHGANDIKIAEKGATPNKKSNSLKFILSYIIFVLISALAFYWLPKLALIIFILFSAYHFGEQHWVHKVRRQSLDLKLFFLLYGLFVLSVLFYTNHTEVSLIIRNIASVDLDQQNFFALLIGISLVLALVGTKIVLNKKLNTNLIEEFFYLGVLFVVFYTASLLWAFAIYFIFWHSIPSLIDQVYFLYGNTKRENFYKYLKSSLLYWLISIIGLSILYLIFHDQEDLFLAIFFSAIAAITFPHVWIMTKLKR